MLNWLRKYPLWISPRVMSWAVFTFFLLALLSIVFAPEPWPVRSTVFPLLVTSIALVLSAFEIAVNHVPWLNARFRPGNVLDLGLPEDMDQSSVNALSNAAILWVAAVVAGFGLVGFHVTAAIFVFAYLRLKARASYFVATLYTAGLWVLVFLGFASLISIPWPTPLILQLY